MGKITMQKTVIYGVNYYTAYDIFDVSSEVEKLFISKGWAIKSPKKVEEIVEEIEGFCKAITNFTTTVDPDTGEAHEFYPASKKSTTSIKKTVK